MQKTPLVSCPFSWMFPAHGIPEATEDFDVDFFVYSTHFWNIFIVDETLSIGCSADGYLPSHGHVCTTRKPAFSSLPSLPYAFSGIEVSVVKYKKIMFAFSEAKNQQSVGIN
jgi:hypothetical protein